MGNNFNSFSTLTLEADAEDIATITLNRPEKLNALDSEVLGEIETAFHQARQHKGVILTGAGEKAFAAGADIQEFTDLDPIAAHRFALRGQDVLRGIETMPIPVVAAINGYALGGGLEIALACHLRVASENAQFGLPEVGLGLIPGYGGTQRLPRLVGLGLASEMILTGDRIGAQRAYAIGLVNRVVPQDALLAEARALLSSILSKAPIAVTMALRALQASELPLASGLQQEAALFGQACATSDFEEGVSAFLNRRKPDFKGR
ncbi:enoyl-CoA hydratase-related protein [soil metagenome]